MGRYNNPYSSNQYDTYYDRENDTYYTRQPYKKYDDDDDDEGGISWITIGLCMIFIQPVGFFLLFLKIMQIIRNSAKQTSRKISASKAKKKQKQKEPFSTKKLLNIGFYAALALAAIYLLSGLTGLDGLGYGASFFSIVSPFIQSALLFVGAFVMKHMSKNLSRRERRYVQYLSIIGNRPYIKLAELAKTAGVNVQQCGRDIEEMMEKKMLVSTAYIDVGRQMLVLNPALVPEENTQPAVKEAEGNYSAILKEFRRLDDDIEDEVISAKIRTIEHLTSQIFDEVERKPEKLSNIRSLLNYYLPTTLKLLQNYADLEDQWAGGENIQTARKDIESIMDTLVQCYQMQLDKLFANEKLDISSDIKVLENMMARDGIGEGQLRTFSR